MKKLFMLTATVIMAILCLAFSASAADVSGKCGDNATWSFDKTNQTLTISGTGPMYDYEAYDAPYDSWVIKSIVVGSGVTHIGNNAFYNESVESITLPDSITSIGKFALYYCSNLKNITLPKNLRTIGERAFSQCINLETIKVNSSNSYFSSDTYGVLYNKTKTELIISPAKNGVTTYVVPSSVKIIGEYAFYRSASLKSVVIPKGVTTIRSTHLTHATILNLLIYLIRW